MAPSQARRGPRPSRPRRAGSVSVGGVPSLIARSCAESHRSEGSFARQMATSWSNHRGTSGRTEEGGGGSRVSTAPSASAWLAPGNARRLVAISYSTAPNAKMSEQPSACFPFACSGAM